MANIQLFRVISTNELKRNTNRIIMRQFSDKGPATNIEVKEVKIPTKWGHISGKLWGSDQKRPLLALHGWQDNAGTWDALLPLLPRDCSVLAVDFPGHGQSSWFPPGMHYYGWNWPHTIQIIKDYYKWDKVSLLAHSMGSIASLRYSILFPDTVDLFIGFENLIMEKLDVKYILKSAPQRILKLEIEDQRLDTEPPSYPYAELHKILHEGTGKSVSLESAKYLIARGTKPSKNDPKKFYFCRDSRLKHILFIPEDKDFVRAFAASMKIPGLYIKATDSDYATDEFSLEIRDILLKTNNKFECKFVPGTHHVHLNNPESVAPLVTAFLKKHNVINDETMNMKVQNRL